jgi:hypothetical protein
VAVLQLDGHLIDPWFGVCVRNDSEVDRTGCPPGNIPKRLFASANRQRDLRVVDRGCRLVSRGDVTFESVVTPVRNFTPIIERDRQCLLLFRHESCLRCMGRDIRRALDGFWIRLVGHTDCCPRNDNPQTDKYRYHEISAEHV